MSSQETTAHELSQPSIQWSPHRVIPQAMQREGLRIEVLVSPDDSQRFILHKQEEDYGFRKVPRTSVDDDFFWNVCNCQPENSRVFSLHELIYILGFRAAGYKRPGVDNDLFNYRVKSTTFLALGWYCQNRWRLKATVKTIERFLSIWGERVIEADPVARNLILSDTHASPQTTRRLA